MDHAIASKDPYTARKRRTNGRAAGGWGRRNPDGGGGSSTDRRRNRCVSILQVVTPLFSGLHSGRDTLSSRPPLRGMHLLSIPSPTHIILTGVQSVSLRLCCILLRWLGIFKRIVRNASHYYHRSNLPRHRLRWAKNRTSEPWEMGLTAPQRLRLSTRKPHRSPEPPARVPLSLL